MPAAAPVTPTLDNYAAIAARYNALVPPRKGETPTRNALASVGALLAADQAPGEKFILFVTDGQPDYCDDGNELCPPDSVVGELQTLSKAGVKTLVFGISSPLSTVSDVALSGFANAGAGQPVAPLVPDLNAIFDQCAGVPGWAADFATTGKQATRGHTVGDYNPAGGGTAKVFKPDLTNQQALVGAISAALSGVKSCVFDLGNLEGKAIKVDRTQLGKAHVLVMGTQIPLDDANGWSMTTDTQLQLSGAACEAWRKPENTMIDFQFPCELIVDRDNPSARLALTRRAFGSASPASGRGAERPVAEAPEWAQRTRIRGGGPAEGRSPFRGAASAVRFRRGSRSGRSGGRAARASGWRA